MRMSLTPADASTINHPIHFFFRIQRLPLIAEIFFRIQSLPHNEEDIKDVALIFTRPGAPLPGGQHLAPSDQRLEAPTPAHTRGPPL